MESPYGMMTAAGPGAWLQLLFFVGGLLWALVVAGILAFRWRVPPILGAAPLIAQPLAAAIGTSIIAWQVADLSPLPSDERPAALAAAIGGVLSNGVLLLAVVPIALILGLGGTIAGARAPRAWWGPLSMAPFLGFTSLLPLIGFAWDVPTALVVAQVLLGLALALPLSAAFANAHPKGNGTEGAMIAAAAWIAVVGAFEAAKWGLAAALPADYATLGKEALQAMVVAREGLRNLSWFCFALTLVPAIFAWLRNGPDLTEDEMLAGLANPSPWRGMGIGLALLTWVAWAVAMSACDPGKLLVRLQNML